MGLIVRAAYLKLCDECKNHGRIVTSEGRHSPEFGTKHDGFITIKTGVQLGILSKEEGSHLREEVRNSPIANCEADLPTQITVSVFNETVREIKALTDLFSADHAEKESFFAEEDPGEAVH